MLALKRPVLLLAWQSAKSGIYVERDMPDTTSLKIDARIGKIRELKKHCCKYLAFEITSTALNKA